MANISRTIDIIFNGKDNISGSVGKITRSIKMVSRAIEDIADPVARAVDKLIQMEAAVLALGAAIGTIALASFKNYEFALIDLEKVLRDDEIPLLKEAQKEIEDLAIKYGTSAIDMVKSTTDFKRAGFSLKDSLTLVNRSLELSSAGMVDMSEATNNIIAIMKGFRFEVEDATKVVDIVNKLSDTYATNATELSDALRRVAPAADLAGLSIEKTAAILIPAIEVFRSGEEAGTAWRRGLIKLTDDAAPVIAALDRLGVAQREGPNKTLRDGADILEDLIKAMQGATSANQLFAASQIFGNRQASKVITSLRDMNYVMEIETAAAGVEHEYTMRQVQKRWASFDVQLGASTTAINLVAVALGERLKPAATNVLGAVTELFASFRDNLREGAFDTLFDLLEGFGDRLSEYLLDVGKELPNALRDIDYSSLLGAFEGLFDEISEIINRFDLDTPEGLRNFLQETADTAAGLIHVTTGLVDKFDEFGLKVLEIIRNFKNLGSEEQKSMGRVAATLKIIDKFGVKGALILREMAESGINIADSMVRIGGGIEAAGGAAEIGLTLLKEPFKFLYTQTGVFVDLLNMDFVGAWDRVKHHAKGTYDGLRDGSENVADGIITLTTGVNGLEDSMDGVASSVEAMEASFTNAFVSVEDGMDHLALFVADEFGSIMQAADDAANKMAKSITENLDPREGIEEAIGWWHSEIGKYINETEENTPKPFTVNADREREWEEYKRSLLSVAEETTDRTKKAGISLDDWQADRDAGRLSAAKSTGKKMTEFYGKFTDESLSIFKSVVPGLTEYDRQVSEAIDQGDEEFDVPDTTKFKAEQAKLLKEIDTNADIMEAKLDAFSEIAKSDAETIASSFEAVGETFSSTGDLLTELYHQAAEVGPDLIAQGAIQRKITEEEARRAEAFELQKELTTAQIELIKQRSAAMAGGDPMITVSGDGLQPHLEAFMWEILSAIQVRVNEDYGSFLLGIGAA